VHVVRIGLILALAVLVAGCAEGRGGDASQKQHLTTSSASPVVAMSGVCPTHPGRLPRDAVAAAAETALRSGGTPRSARIVASALASSGGSGSRGAEVRYQCGEAVARRTVVVDLFYPSMLPSASLSQGTLFVSYFGKRGYRIWEVAH
jgi:hypothetical protein